MRNSISSDLVASDAAARQGFSPQNGPAPTPVAGPEAVAAMEAGVEPEAGMELETGVEVEALLQLVPPVRVVLQDGFWAPRRVINREVVLPQQYHGYVSTGRLENFLRVGEGRAQSAPTVFFNDSDLYKWLEAAIWSLASDLAQPGHGFRADAPVLRVMVENIIDTILAAQQDDGYLNTYFMFFRAEGYNSHIRNLHDQSCARHLQKAATAHHFVTGSRRLLDASLRFSACLSRELNLSNERRDKLSAPQYSAAIPSPAAVSGSFTDATQVESEPHERRVVDMGYNFRFLAPSPPPAIPELAAPGTLTSGTLTSGTLVSSGALSTPAAPLGLPDGRPLPACLGSEMLSREPAAKALLKQPAEPAREPAHYSPEHTYGDLDFPPVATDGVGLDGDMGNSDCHYPLVEVAIESLWENLTELQADGADPGAGDSCFQRDEAIPGPNAFIDVAASVQKVMANWSRLQVKADVRAADAMEFVLFNEVLPGISLDGQSCLDYSLLTHDKGDINKNCERHPWFNEGIFPPNIAGLLSVLPDLSYSVSNASIWVHLYATGVAQCDLLPSAPEQSQPPASPFDTSPHQESGRRTVTLKQTSRYPWDGDIKLEITDIACPGPTECNPRQERGGEQAWALNLRIPAWCARNAIVAIDGQVVAVEAVPGTYVRLNRHWRKGDTVRLQLPMSIQGAVRQAAFDSTSSDSTRVALLRGPLLYCIEGIDHNGVQLSDIRLPWPVHLADKYRAEFAPGCLGGMVVLRGPAVVATQVGQTTTTGGIGGGGAGLPATGNNKPAWSKRRIELTAIPYYAWGNREIGAMQVWLHTVSSG